VGFWHATFDGFRRSVHDVETSCVCLAAFFAELAAVAVVAGEVREFDSCTAGVFLLPLACKLDLILIKYETFKIFYLIKTSGFI
jgi:hypothetical protein